MKRRELLWMIVPCLLLSGAGWKFWQREQATRGPLRLFVDEAVVVPLTPLDAAQGWDTRVRVKTRMHGIPSFQPTTDLHAPRTEWGHDADYTIVAPRTGKSWKWKLDQQNMAGSSYSTGDSVEHTAFHVFHLKTNVIPASAGPLELRINLRGERWESHFESEDGDHSFWKRTNYEKSVVPVKILVRSDAALKSPPTVSKERPFKLLGFRTSWESTGGGQTPKIIIVIRPDVSPGLKWRGDFVRIVTPRYIVDGQEEPIQGFGISTSQFPNRQDIESELDHLPAFSNKARNIIFKANLSVNECWPLPVEIELRKDGKNITHVKPKLDK